jgi:benzoylformate decarboxylase
LNPATKLVHLDNAVTEVERIYPTEVGILADPSTGLEELTDALGQDMSASAKEAAATRAAAFAEERRQSAETYQRRLSDLWNRRPMAVERMMHELAKSAPPNTIVADESITSRPAEMQEFTFDQPGSMYAIRGGALGWAMPGALGVQLANPDRPVLAIVGDGASLYTVQALWTAARYNIPVVYAICNNRSYRVLKVNMDIYLRRMLEDQDRESEYVGMDFANPLDLAAIARGMGVSGEKIEDPEALGPALRRAYDSGKPAVIDVSIDGAA